MDLQHRDPFHYIDSFDDPAVRQLIRCPISDLETTYDSDDRWKSYFSQLAQACGAYRPCESDADSLLRAFGFALMESYARQWSPSHDLFFELRMKIVDGEEEFAPREKYLEQMQILCDTLERITNLCRKNPSMSIYHVQTLLGKTWFDAILRAVLRMILLNYLELHTDDLSEELRSQFQAIIEDGAELAAPILSLLCKIFTVTVQLFDFSGAYEQAVLYADDESRPIDFSLYQLNSGFGVLYNKAELEKDKFDPETRRFDLGSNWDNS